MSNKQQRHDISDEVWNLLEPHLPGQRGKRGTICQHFRRWRDKGIWEKLLEILVDELDFEWLMIDASHCKVHPHAAGAQGGSQDMSRTKGG